MNNGVWLNYGNYAPEAKENFVASATDKASFSNLDNLNDYQYKFYNYGSPCEEYNTLLDGSALIIPNQDTVNVAFWSEQISDENGNFTNPIVLTLTAEQNYSSPGLVLTFDKNNNVWATSINVKWYNGTSLLSNQDYTPNSAIYEINNDVELYNKIVITFNKINAPKTRLRFTSIDYGSGAIISKENIQSVGITQEINPISVELIENTANVTLQFYQNENYLFQRKQPISIYFNDRLLQIIFIKSISKKGQHIVTLKGEDYLGLMSDIDYKGGIFKNKNAISLIGDICDTANVSYEIDTELSDESVTGYIPYTTCRDALQQVAFAIGAVVDTSNSEKVRIFKLNTSETKTINASRIMQGQTFDEEDKITRIEITAHKYVSNGLEDEEVDLYDASEDGEGTEILVVFSEPIHDLIISSGIISEYDDNYAIISARDSSCKLRGHKYVHTTFTKGINNPNVTASDPEKVATISDATLISKSNIDNVLEACMNYYKINTSLNSDIIEKMHVLKNSVYGQNLYGTVKYGKGVNINWDSPINLGDILNVSNFNNTLYTGTLIRQFFNISRYAILKETVVK